MEEYQSLSAEQCFLGKYSMISDCQRANRNAQMYAYKK